MAADEALSAPLKFESVLWIVGKEADTVLVRLTGADGRVRGPITMRIPIHELGATGLSAALQRDDGAGVERASFAYGRILRQHIDAALSGDELPGMARGSLGIGDHSVLVCIAGGPRVHQILWEAMDVEPLVRQHSAATLFVHLTDETQLRADEPEMTNNFQQRHVSGRIRWVGARPLSEDLPRYLVAGPVAERVITGNSLSFEALRTNASLREALALLGTESDSPAALITHLDVHGMSRMREGSTKDSLVDAEFSALFADGVSPVAVSDQTLEELVRRSAAQLFLTNACFGAQQRELNQWSFPGRLVSSGVRIAVAARDPLDGNAAMLFFTALYSMLAERKSVAESYMDARAFLATRPRGHESGPITDVSARYALQPVLWVQNINDLGLVFYDRHSITQPALETLAPYVELTPLNDSFARFVEDLEDACWSQHDTASPTVSARASLELSTVRAISDALRIVFGANRFRVAHVSDDSRDTASERIDPPLLTFPELSELENFLLVAVRFIGQPNPLRELLGFATHSDASYIDKIAELSGGDVTHALLHALSWGPGELPRVPIREALRDLEGQVHEACASFLEAEDHARDHTAGNILAGIVNAHKANWALPLFAVGTDDFLNVAAPKHLEVPHPFIEELLSLGRARILRAGDKNALSLSSIDQIAVRQSVPPLEVVRARENILDRVVSKESKPAVERSAWNEGTRRICVAWLAIAIAYRQVGLIHTRAVSTALHIISLVDRDAAVGVAFAMAKGLPTWHALAGASVAEAYSQYISVIDKLIKGSDDSHLIADPTDDVESALALLHAGRPAEALAITSRLSKGADYGSPSTSFELTKTHAYALAHTGDVGQALAFIAPHIANLGSLPLYNQCEFLHLLADLAEHQRKYNAAIRYMLQERALKSPALHRQLHNRDHLLSLLTTHSTSDDIALIAVIATEGLLFAHAAEDTAQLTTFARTIIECARDLDPRQRHRLLSLLDSSTDLQDNITVAVTRVALARDELDPLVPEAVDTLTGALTETGIVQSFAAFMLAKRPNISDQERIELLEKGATNPDTRFGQLCRIGLLPALWTIGRWEDLKRAAEMVLADHPTLGIGHLAMAAYKLHSGDRSAALGRAARAFAYEGAVNLRKGYGIPPGVREPEFIADCAQLVIPLLETHATALERGEEGPLPGMSLGDVIDRVYEYNVFEDPLDERVIGTLLSMSEDAWDRSDYPVAINARRRACQLLERLGEPQRGRRAEELGWLATLVKQSGDLEQALSLYQLAVQIGGDSLESHARSSLTGRYANLLHELGDYAVAARVQWQAVLAQRTDIDLDPRFPLPFKL
jgi:tetratricopeptide (TPR) repeat protein